MNTTIPLITTIESLNEKIKFHSVELIASDFNFRPRTSFYLVILIT